jgi:CheY-like chemotaxis protein
MARVLIVEDDTIIRRSIAYLLRNEGYDTAEASNGLEAIQYLRQNEHPCLIFLDLMMPVMDGEQFRHEQLKDSNLSPIPVVVLSGDGNASAKAQALNTQGFLIKPIMIQDLMRYIEEYC